MNSANEKGRDTSGLCILIRVFLIVAVIGFLCPFVMVSCGRAEDASVQISGMELTFGISQDEDVQEIFHETGPNISLLMVLVMIFIALVMAKTEKPDGTCVASGWSCGASGCGILFLWIFRITLIDKYLEGDTQGLTIDYRFGYWLTLFMLIFACAAALLSIYMHSNAAVVETPQKEPPKQIETTAPPEPPEEHKPIRLYEEYFAVKDKSKNILICADEIHMAYLYHPKQEGAQYVIQLLLKPAGTDKINGYISLNKDQCLLAVTYHDAVCTIVDKKSQICENTLEVPVKVERVRDILHIKI